MGIQDGRVIDYETWLRSKDGHEIPIRLSAATLYDAKGERRGAVGYFVDLRPFETERRKREAWEMLYEASQAITRSRDFDEALHRIAEQAWRLTKQDGFASIRLLEDQTKLRLVAVYPPEEKEQLSSKRTEPRDLRTGKVGVTGRAALIGEGQRVGNVHEDEDYLELHRATQAELAWPIKSGSAVLGVINVESPVLNAFDEEDEATLRLLAELAGIVIEKERLHERTKKDASALKGLYDAGQAIISASTLNDTLNQVAKQALKLIGLDPNRTGCFSHIALLEGSNKLVFVEASSEAVRDILRLPEQSINLASDPKIGIAGRAFRTGETVYVPDVRRSLDFLAVQSKILTQLSVPLKVNVGPTIGVLSIEHPDPNAFNDEDIKNIELLAALAAVAINNAKQYEELVARTTTKQWRRSTVKDAETIQNTAALLIQELKSTLKQQLPPSVLNKFALIVECSARIVVAERLDSVRLNRNMVFHEDDQEGLPIISLVALIEKNLPEQIPARVEELKDLFRCMFYSWGEVALHQRLWNHDGMVAVKMRLLSAKPVDEWRVVICGKSELMKRVTQCYQEIAPTGDQGPVLREYVELPHFAAIALDLTGAHEFESIRSIDVYSEKEKTIGRRLDKLLKLQENRQSAGSTYGGDKALEEYYLEITGLTTERISPATLIERIQWLVKQIPRLGMRNVRFEGTAQSLKIIVESNKHYEYDDPTPKIHQTWQIGSLVELAPSLGLISWDTILADKEDHVWPSDFSKAGYVPRLLRYVALEADIRFDWTETTELGDIHDMERCLVEGDFISLKLPGVVGKLEPQDFDKSLHKPLHIIQHIRKQAKEAGLVVTDPRPYHLGIFFCAAKRLADIKLDMRLGNRELAHLAHALISMAVIAHSFASAPSILGSSLLPPLRVRNGEAYKGDKRLSFTERQFELFDYLMSNSGRHITEKKLTIELRSDAVAPGYWPNLIGILRRKIGDDPDHPRYLLNDRGLGYCLIPDPDKQNVL